MKEVIAFHSAKGNYYYIGKDEKGYYLRNRHTTIPNEFEKYSMEKIKELFDDLCERILECVPVDQVLAGRHVNSYMYVVYDDMTEQLFMQQEGVGRNLCAYNCNVADYDEFLDEFLGFYNPGTLTLERLRQVCKCKREDLDILLNAVRAMRGDDYTYFDIEPRQDGGYNIVETCYCVPNKEFITIMEDGSIGNTGELTYIKLLKEQGVHVYKNT